MTTLAGACYERYEGTASSTSAGNDGWGSSCASRAAKATRSDFSSRSTLTYLGVACRAEHRGKPAKAGQMRDVLLSARRAKPAETLTWPSRTPTLSGMAASVRSGHRRAMPRYRHGTHANRRAGSRFHQTLLWPAGLGQITGRSARERVDHSSVRTQEKPRSTLLEHAAK